jgi:TusA-related sulfurtransferase
MAGGVVMSEMDLSQIKSNKIVDARGSACPGPLMEAKKAIGAVPVGGILEVWSNDPGTKEDIPAWARKVGHEFIGVLRGDGYDRVFVVRKK